MGQVGIFINLTKANETGLRESAFTDWLPNGAVDPNKGVVYGGGDYPANLYSTKAEKLINDNPNATLFIATCWPSLDALDKAMAKLGVSKSIVFAGLVTPNSAVPSQSTGIMAFDINSLCPNWPALLLQIAPGMTKAGVVYDNGHPGPTAQYTAITNTGLLQFTPILANTTSGSPSPPKDDKTIANDIAAYAKSAGAGAGLIVTACTLTGMLREAVAKAAKNNDLIAIFPAEMYTRRTSSFGLMSYGPDLLAMYASATSGDATQILQGATPGSIQVTTIDPANYKLVVNRNSANKLKLTIPPQFTVTFGGVKSTIMPTID